MALLASAVPAQNSATVESAVGQVFADETVHANEISGVVPLFNADSLVQPETLTID